MKKSNLLFYLNSLALVLIGIMSLALLYKLSFISRETVTTTLLAVQYAATIYVIMIFGSSGKLKPYIKQGMAHKIKFTHVVFFSLVFGIIQRIFVEFMLKCQDYLGIGFNIGSNQALPTGSIYDVLFVTGIIAPFLEEFLFRVMLFTTVLILVKFIMRVRGQQAFDCVYNLKHPICICTILFSTIIFSIAHGPDITSFHFYALGGLIYSILYVKYGYLAAVLTHFSFNFLSCIILPAWFF